MRFDIQEIKSNSYVMPLERLLRKMREGGVHRRFFDSVDSIEFNREAYIEEILMGLPLQPFYVTALNQMATWKVIDGQKRLDTLNLFFNLEDMAIRYPRYVQMINGLRYADFSYSLQRRLLETEVTVHVLTGRYTLDKIEELYKIINKKK